MLRRSAGRVLDECPGSAGRVERRGGQGRSGAGQHTGPPLENTGVASGGSSTIDAHEHVLPYPRCLTVAAQGCSAFTGAGLLEGISWVVGDVAARVYTFD